MKYHFCLYWIIQFDFIKEIGTTVSKLYQYEVMHKLFIENNCHNTGNSPGLVDWHLDFKGLNNFL